MYVQVRLLKGFSELLWYKVPSDWDANGLVGITIKVPFRTQFLPAVIEKVSQEKPNVSFAIKEAIMQEAFPQDNHYNVLIKQLSFYYQIPEIYFIKRLRQFLSQKELERPRKEKPLVPHYQEQQEIALTQEQQEIVDSLKPFLAQEYKPALIHGVTGSGKTEVYKALIEHSLLSLKKSVILLLPEVTLAVQFTQRLQKDLPQSIEIFSFHSATSVKEKRVLWQKLIKGEPILIIGVHLPILLPIAHMGLIIIDEEHEVGYQEKKHPKINSKEVALMRAKLYNIPIILGSATPSIQSLYNVTAKKWLFFQLKKRFAGAFPQIKIVPLNDKKQRRHFWLTQDLINALKDRLAKKEQSIIFLNRRGYSFFVQCKQCSFIFECSHCSVSLTLHEPDILRCHYCDFAISLPSCCTKCKADKKDFLKKGIGTQQLVAMLEYILPQARIARADLDTTINKKQWQKTMDDFQEGNLDILVGTQTITKGYHFPKVTLVGILWADLNLHFPIYNAAETALQQLIQVAGRAGRERENSLVIVQTMMDHAVFDYLHEVNYLQFFQQELEARKTVGYPPALRLAEIELKYDDEKILEREAQSLSLFLADQIKKNAYNITLLGPALPPIYKIKNYFVRKIYLKSPDIMHIINLAKSIHYDTFKSAIFLTQNPLS
ncbi:MAG: primosomal protein N' [Candidatus Babeliales bacterium]